MVLNNKNNAYYGHGTIGGDEIITSIFNNGIRCSHEQLYFTTVVLGVGRDTLFDDVRPTIDNWPHLGAKNIIIASMPLKYMINHSEREGAYYNYLTPEEASKKSVSPGYYLMPEFVLGCYNSETKQFRENAKYYEKLPKEEQTSIEDQIKRRYLNIISEVYGIEKYKEILKELPEWEFPLSDEEVTTLTSNDQKETLESLRNAVIQKNERGETLTTTDWFTMIHDNIDQIKLYGTFEEIRERAKNGQISQKDFDFLIATMQIGDQDMENLLRAGFESTGKILPESEEEKSSLL